MDLLRYTLQNTSYVGGEAETARGIVDSISNMSCRYSLSVMDFLPQETLNDTHVEMEWPCEVREYWVDISGLVIFVRFLFDYISVFIVALGLVLNTIAFLTLRSPSLVTNSMSIYLQALALSDNGVLVFSTAVNVLRRHCEPFNMLIVEHGWLCICHRITSGLFFHYSAWLVVALTFERLLMIRWPMHSYSICRIRPAIFVTTLVGLVVFLLNLARLKTQGFEQESVYEYASCSKVGRSENWSNSTYLFISISTWIPTFLIVVGNACIVYHLHQSANQRSKLSETNYSPGPDTCKLTKLLIMVSTVYVVLLLPIGIVGSIDLYWRVHRPSQSYTVEYIKWKKQSLLLKWLRGLFFFIYSCNFAINFFVYCMSGNNFRHAVKTVTEKWLSSFCYKYICDVKKSIHAEAPQTNTISHDVEINRRQKVSSTASTVTLIAHDAES
ncbi:uncharacterized protein LOC124555545 isoform X1 [Schistocerca americana]|uniref:uncharacterized protein LOC124555545 isoform X1 n=1 Tax=Schistocerca americana TaxID=7009 RepID=UPI001F4F1FCB|nr:uncharacterized protein LOC124555545 isoform X1 [Schistocerca americana]